MESHQQKQRNYPRRSAWAVAGVLFTLVHTAEVRGDSASFPLMIAHGTSAQDRSLQWSDLPPTMQQPRVALAKFDIRGCRFGVLTGPIAAGQLESTRDQYVNDSLPRRSVLQLDTGDSVYLRFSTDLRVRMEPGRMAACRAAFQGRRTPIGRLSLASSSLLAQGANDAATGPMIHAIADKDHERGEMVTIDWPAHHTTPHIAVGGNATPSILSPVYRVSAAGRGKFFVDVLPRLDRSRIQAPVAANENTSDVLQRGNPALPVADYSSMWGPDTR